MREDWHIDFETFSHLVPGGVNGVGSCRYAEDPSTEILCLAYGPRKDQMQRRIWVPDDAIEKIERAVSESHEWLAKHRDAPRKQKQVPAHERLVKTGRKFLGPLSPAHGGAGPLALFDAVKRGARIWAWNAEFEMAIWSEIAVKQLGWPAIPFDQWRDTEANALSLGFPPALGMAGAALGLATQKDKRGKQLLTKLASPRKPTQKDPATRWTPYSAAQDFIDLYAYCFQDVGAEAAIHHALPIDDLPPKELATWRMTVRMNQRGWTIDVDSVHRIVAMLKANEKVVLAELAEFTRGKITTANQTARMKVWLEEQGVLVENFQADTIDEVLKKRSELPAEARRLLEIRQEMGLSSIAKYYKMLKKLCRDGTVKNSIIYHGASTGRDAGRGIQPQNFVRKQVSKNQRGVELAFQALRTEQTLATVQMLYGYAPHFASALLRPCLIARPGHELYSADFGQVESRITVWYADDEFGINTFKQKLDPYKMLAVDIFNVDYEDVTGEQRQVCKPIELGCCFQMGAKALKKSAEGYGVSMSLKLAQTYVDTYRAAHPGVVKLWKGLSHAAKRAVRGDRPFSYGRITFERRGNFLYMKLASDRELAYYRPRVELVLAPWGDMIPAVTFMGRNSVTRKWERQTLTPGTMTNNAVQGTARDAMMTGAHNVEQHGFPLVGRTHDELISQARVGFSTLERYEELMCPPLSWLTGIPIIAEGWVGRRYRK